MKTTIGSTIDIYDYSEEILKWCRDNLVVDNPEYLRRVRMNKWVGNTPQRLHLYQKRGDVLSLPYGVLERIKPLIKGGKIIYDTPIAMTQSELVCREEIPLYGYQEEAVNAMLRSMNGILHAPAGSGKTQMGLAMATSKGYKTLWLTHTKDLLNQSKERAEQYIDKELIGTITEGKVDIGEGITFATVQTMCRLDLPKYRYEWEMVIVDECFRGDTEVLTDEGWKRFDSLSKNEKIAQYNPNGTVEFVTPIRHIKRKHDTSLLKFTLKDGRDIYMTPNHIQPLFYRGSNEIKQERIKEFRSHRGGLLITSGKGTGNNEPLSPMERLAIASQADGTIQRVCEDHVSWTMQLNKERKVERMKMILNEAGVEWREIKPSQSGCVRYAYQTPLNITKKLNTTFDLNVGVDRARDIIEEVSKWDGSEVGAYDYYYSSTVKENAELVSAIAFLGGYRSVLTIEHDTRQDNYLDVYRVYGHELQYQSTQRCKRRYVPYEGDVYCVEVPSHMIVVRAEGYAFVSGNCHRVSGTPTSISQFYKVLNSLSTQLKYGLSATVHRSDGMIVATHALLGDTVHIVGGDEVGDKVMKVGIKPISTGVKPSGEYINYDGTLNYTSLISYLTESDKRNEVIVKSIIENKGRPSLILSDRLIHLEQLMDALPDDMRQDAVMVSGRMTSKAGKEARNKAIEDMRGGRKKYLFATYTLAKEGLDIPRLERLYLASPQKDYAIVTQSIGRVARVFEGKADPVVYDFVDEIGYLNRAYRKRCTIYKKNGCYFVEDKRNG